MRLSSILSRARHDLLIAALLCVLIARVAVPAGWMPMLTADGGFVLAPCSGMGAVPMANAPSAHGMPAHDMAGMTMAGMAGAEHHVAPDKPNDRHPDPAGDHPCSGAGVAVALTTPPVALPAALALAAMTVPSARLIPNIGQGLAAPPPPSTGPPTLA
ncbi:hypothetical protein ASG11_14970 [Sphingomonas sp. Leaf357]|uniref:hypothetical protein n=1 Tax=Sphingomonas sp. Leaf357 TaxID=1736350 RepID=UPI00070131C0|nr:hypothetical protein [Sphingomonas sp. Leaf357]KQS02091.1 hypothetical protein ASG11_14970 [Sphingomonas sp. Leaf357]